MSDFSSMSRADIKSDIGMYIVDDIGSGSSIDKAYQLLAGISHGAEKAIGSAIKRAATSGEAYAAKAVGKFYYIKAGDFKHYTKSKRHISTTQDGLEISIDFRGHHIPLLRFNARINAAGLYKVQVKKNSAGNIFKHVFRQEVGKHGHIGLYERIYTKRFPIEEKVGPSTPQMMESNDDVSQAIGNKVRETFDKRIDHEITAILNGWRR